MPRKPSRKQYAETIGEITIEWNYLERAMHVIGYRYLKGDVGVASHVFNGMGNVSKAEFVSYLVKRFEKDKKIASHAHHFIKMFSRLRENRNIIEHSVPAQTKDRRYDGQIHKPNKRGETMIFPLPMKTLTSVLEDLVETAGYGRIISAAISTDGDQGDDIDLIRATLASLKKPPLPHKLTPLPPPEDL